MQGGERLEQPALFVNGFPGAKHRLRRRPAFAVFAALSAMSLLAATPTAAEVLVSNIGQPDTTPGNLGSLDLAQQFTTGANTQGYTLESVELRFSTAPSGVSVKVATSANDGDVVATLTNPSSLTTGNLTFTAPANTTLSASTNYWVLLEATSGVARRTTSDSEDFGRGSRLEHK